MEDSLPRSISFRVRERARQTDYFNRHFPDKVDPDLAAYRLRSVFRSENLAPAIRSVVTRYFCDKDIAWHTHANHALSSQVCCLNFLIPLAEKPEILSRLVARALGIAPPEMLEIEPGPDGRPWYIGFEWIGKSDYLREARDGHRTRGTNVTSADAFVRYRTGSGDVESLLIEWKYTESYGPPIPAKGNPTRIERYRDIAFDPDGPIRADRGLKLEDFFWEPFYQLLRQQMLAYRMQRAPEEETTHVRVLHIAPAENRALRKVTAPKMSSFGEDAFKAFKAVLVKEDDFISRTTEEIFGSLITGSTAGDWGSYLTQRYEFAVPRTLAVATSHE